jgi:hypothetical protein
MDDRIAKAVGRRAEAYVVGGAIRDELLGRDVVDVDVACRRPEKAARKFARRSRAAVFPLSERHGAWRVAFRDGQTVDFTPLQNGIHADLASRDFTINAIARPVRGGNPIDPFGGLADLNARRLRAVSPTIFADDPLRLLRAVRLEDELAFRLDAATETLVRDNALLVTRPAGERLLAELERLSPAGFRRLQELGLLAPLGGTLERLGQVDRDFAQEPGFLLVAVFGGALRRFPISNERRRFADALLGAERPVDDSPRAIHRFRRRTEPWALEALAFLGATELYPALARARANDPDQPLVRGDELGVPPGPEVGRLLELIAEERAAGTISTREEALRLVERRRGR